MPRKRKTTMQQSPNVGRVARTVDTFRLTTAEISRRSGLCPQTVSNMRRRLTKEPRDSTVTRMLGAGGVQRGMMLDGVFKPDPLRLKLAAMRGHVQRIAQRTKRRTKR